MSYNEQQPVMAKRNDHSATLWRNHHLVVFGGTGDDDDDDTYFSQIAVLHLPSLTWELPQTSGMVPLTGRIKHSATIHNDKLYIAGGLEPGGHYANTVLILDLVRNEWLTPIPFVCRSQHVTFFYNQRLYLYGGYHEDLTRSNNTLTFLDTNSHTVTQLEIDSPNAPRLHGQQYAQICGDQLVVAVMDPDHVEALDDEETATDVEQMDEDEDSLENHDMVEPMTLRSQRSRAQQRSRATRRSTSTSSSTLKKKGKAAVRHASKPTTGVWHLDLAAMQWQAHQDVPVMLDGCHWQIFGMQEHADWFALFGASDDDLDEYYGLVLRIQLKEHGIVAIPPSRLGMDLAGLLTDDGQASADFVIRSSVDPDAQELHVHRLVLLARWPHFAHLMQAGMVESFSNSMTLPEPHQVLHWFVHFLYTDALDDAISPLLVADLMIMANLYMLPRLLALCVRRLYANVTVDYCSKIYQAAVQAGQDGLQQTALTYLFRHFGQVVQTAPFHALPAPVLANLLDQVPYFSSIAISQLHANDTPATTATLFTNQTAALPPFLNMMPSTSLPPRSSAPTPDIVISGRSTPNLPSASQSLRVQPHLLQQYDHLAEPPFVLRPPSPMQN
ncbi:hypothetical protein DM01DRAFT_1335375 [Hesseltinella vesiculosa]|uniref:BTB domain-containing protein n=1 Tax=Hesseltinella vesiculosa TaxID=101127 RepID=A0A1X2GJF4_9FUNG|nr:hypothetical protein DM01DRAFT_1335375 [Hesseltinella vesiculosa]